MAIHVAFSLSTGLGVPEPFRQAQGPEHVEGLVEGLDCFVALLASTLLASRVAMTIKNQTDPLPLLDLRAQK